MNTTLSKINNHFSERSSLYNDINSWVYNKEIIEAIIRLAKNNYYSDAVIKYADMGSGTCIVSDELEKRIDTAGQIFAVDINSKMLEQCVNDHIIKINSSIEMLPFLDCYFHVIISRQCLHYIVNVEQALKEIRRVLIPNGKFILAQIIPYDSNTRNYWSEIIKVRQPLRQHYFDELMWENQIIQQGFSLETSQRFVTRSSLADWVKKYKIVDNTQFDKMKFLLENASREYKSKYHVDFTENDIIYDSNWFVKSFSVNQL